MEQDMALVHCFAAEGRIDPGSDCRIMSACVLKGALAKALQAFLDVLDQYTLAELVAPKNRLAELLLVEQA
jgi:Rrf2 family transcriptional regulator, nitric oxide-sensitive transcriptional repressor